MNQRIQRFTKKLRLLERRKDQVARNLDAAERQENISTQLTLEAQYREIMQTIGKLRKVLRFLQPAR